MLFNSMPFTAGVEPSPCFFNPIQLGGGINLGKILGSNSILEPPAHYILLLGEASKKQNSFFSEFLRKGWGVSPNPKFP